MQLEKIIGRLEAVEELFDPAEPVGIAFKAQLDGYIAAHPEAAWAVNPPEGFSQYLFDLIYLLQTMAEN